MSDSLNMSLSGAKPGSSIGPPDPPGETSMEQMLSCIQQYFKDCSYDCGRNYMDGYNVELLRDNIDMSTLLTSLTRMVFDEIRKQEHLDDDKKIELSLIFQSIEKLLQTLKYTNKNVAGNNLLCKIIGYCIKNHQTYK